MCLFYQPKTDKTTTPPSKKRGVPRYENPPPPPPQKKKRFSISLVYVKEDDIILRASIITALNKEEALGISITKTSKDLPDYKLSDNIVLIIE